jgi:hypothetical protein
MKLSLIVPTLTLMACHGPPDAVLVRNTAPTQSTRLSERQPEPPLLTPAAREVPSDVALGPAGKVLLACGSRLVTRHAKVDHVRKLPTGSSTILPHQLSFTIDSVSWGTSNIVVRATTRSISALVQRETHLLGEDSTTTFRETPTESVTCTDAKSRSALILDGSGSLALLDLGSHARRKLPTAAAAQTCALTGDWILIGSDKNVELWDRATLTKVREFPARAGTTAVFALQWHEARFGWLEAYEPMPTMPVTRLRSFTLENRKVSAGGLGAAELNALPQVNEFTWDDSGKSYVLDRSSVRKWDGRSWTQLGREAAPSDCYYGGLRVSPDGAHTLMAQPACRPGGHDGSRDKAPAWIELKREEPPLDLRCPAQ